MKKKDKRGASLLVENIIFIILNLLFFTILILFIVQQGSGLIVLEQSYAKQIALVIDSAKPGMVVFLDFEDGFEKAEENIGDSYDLEKIIKIEGNVVTVKLDNNPDRKGYSYSFFNDIQSGKEIIFYEDRESKGREGIVFKF